MKAAKTTAPPATWEQFSALLDACYATPRSSWAPFVVEYLPRRAVVDALEGRAAAAFKRLDAIESTEWRTLGACDLALAFDAAGDAENAARAFNAALARAYLDYPAWTRAAVYGQMAYTLERFGRADEAATWAVSARQNFGHSGDRGRDERALARYLLCRGECDEANALFMQHAGHLAAEYERRPAFEAHVEGLLARRAWAALFALGRGPGDPREASNVARRCVPAMLAAGEVDALLALLASPGREPTGAWEDLADHAERLGLTDVLRRAADVVFAQTPRGSELPVIFLRWIAPLDEARARRELTRLEAQWLGDSFRPDPSWCGGRLDDFVHEFVPAYARLGLLDRATALIDRAGVPARHANAVRFLHRDGRTPERDAMLDRMVAKGRAAAPDLAAATLLRAAEVAAECGLLDRARALLAEVLAAVAAKQVADKDVAVELVKAFLALDDVAGAWKAYRKIGGKPRKGLALEALLEWSGTHDDPATALDALERYVKERPDDLNLLRFGLDALEASRARRGLRVVVTVF